MTKRATRTAANGLVTAELDGSRAGVLVELNCETDFVAKTDLFQQVAAQIAQAASDGRVGDRPTLLSTEVRPGVTVEQLIEEAGASLKEKLELGRYARFEGGYVGELPAPQRRGAAADPGRAGSSWTGTTPRWPRTWPSRSPRCAAYTNATTCRRTWDKERRIAEQITRDEGKPEQAIGRIVDGRLNAYFKDVVLTEQAFVKDPKTSIKQVLAGSGVTVTGFARFQVGQA